MLAGVMLFSGVILQRELAGRIMPTLQAGMHGSFVERSERQIRDYVLNTESRRLQIGAGREPLEGWLNSDIESYDDVVFLDASKPFPLEDDSFEYIFSEHVIEHLTLEQGDVMLSESYRILKPGGKVRIATPDLKRFLALFGDDMTEADQNYIAGKLRWHGWERRGNIASVILNLQLRSWGHRFVYDEATLVDSLQRAGFENIRRFAVGESDDPELAGVEKRADVSIAAVNDYETMVVQAAKPL